MCTAPDTLHCLWLEEMGGVEVVVDQLDAQEPAVAAAMLCAAAPGGRAGRRAFSLDGLHNPCTQVPETYDLFHTRPAFHALPPISLEPPVISPSSSPETLPPACLPAHRYFDALQGPELDVLKDFEDILLPVHKKWPFLLRFPISTFAISLGLGSQAILWKSMAVSTSMAFLHVPLQINCILWILALTSYTLIFVTYALKALFYFEAVRREYFHPVRVNYFFAPSIAAMFLAIGVPPVISKSIHPAIWWIFMAPLFILEIKIYGQWISRGERRLSKVANPTTQMSVVGNFIGATLGASVGFKEVALFFWAVGAAHYLVVFVTLYQRLPTNESISKDLHPVFFLFIAAPSSASISWEMITGDFGNVAKVIYFVGMFLLILLVARINLFWGFRFSIAWWAYTFPLSATSCASLHYSNKVNNYYTQIITLLISLASTIVVMTLLICTLSHAFISRTLFPNDMAIAITKKKRTKRTKSNIQSEEDKHHGSDACNISI